MAAETIEDITAEMRGWEHHTWMCVSDHEYIESLADRIDAAYAEALRKGARNAGQGD